jgi:hypothetical protein
VHVSFLITHYRIFGVHAGIFIVILKFLEFASAESEGIFYLILSPILSVSWLRISFVKHISLASPLNEQPWGLMSKLEKLTKAKKKNTNDLVNIFDPCMHNIVRNDHPDKDPRSFEHKSV